LVDRVVAGLGVCMRERHLGLVGAIGLVTMGETTLHPRFLVLGADWMTLGEVAPTFA
jgi:hypothetical protein